MITLFPALGAPCTPVSAPIRDFRDLVCWQQAIELAYCCEAVADALPRRAWKTAQQLREAANSVHLNIAEGNGRPSIADYLRCLGIANASLNEVQSNLYFITRRYPAIRQSKDAIQISGRVARPLGGLIRALKRKRDNE
jgi:four helix bundle protein